MVNINLLLDLKKDARIIPLQKSDYTLPDERSMDNMMNAWYEYFDIQVSTANIFNCFETAFSSIDRMMKYLLLRNREFPKQLPER